MTGCSYAAGRGDARLKTPVELAPAQYCSRQRFRDDYEDAGTTLDYDSMKSFGNFMYEIFTGFSLASGYQTRDYFEDMIRAI